MLKANFRIDLSAIPVMIVLTAFFTLQSCSGDSPYVKETFVMGTKASVTIYGLGESDAGRAASDAMGEMHRMENMMSVWKRDSELSRLNRESMGKPLRVSEELSLLVEKAIDFCGSTDGAFDITTGPLIELWGFRAGEPAIPDDGDIEKAAGKTGCHMVRVDSLTREITLEPGTELDLSGIAKGYSVDRCAAVLRELGIESALINLGGNILAIGSPPGKEGWKIGIRDPLGSRNIVGTIVLRNAAVATSGNYENFLEVGDDRYGHIIDPRTGYPCGDVLSVTVMAPDAVSADALSTGLFVLGLQDARTVLDRMPEIKAVIALPQDDGVTFVTIGDFGGDLSLQGSSE